MTDATAASNRRRPVQDRSAQRVEAILDVTAALIDEVGYVEISISMIAKRGGMSGPAVYRYFDDLEAVVRALATRNLTRFIERMTEVLDDSAVEWQDALAAVVRVYCELFRTEPGFRWLRLGDAVDRNLISDEATNRTVVARLAEELFVKRYAVDPRVDLLEHVEVIVEICDTLLARAFQSNPDGDEFFITEAAAIAVQYLGDYLAKPYPKP